MIGLMETYRVGRIPVAQLWQASDDENVLLLDFQQDEQPDGRQKRRTAHLAKCRRRDLVE